MSDIASALEEAKVRRKELKKSRKAERAQREATPATRGAAPPLLAVHHEPKRPAAVDRDHRPIRSIGDVCAAISEIQKTAPISLNTARHEICHGLTRLAAGQRIDHLTIDGANGVCAAGIGDEDDAIFFSCGGIAAVEHYAGATRRPGRNEHAELGARDDLEQVSKSLMNLGEPSRDPLASPRVQYWLAECHEQIRDHGMTIDCVAIELCRRASLTGEEFADAFDAARALLAEAGVRQSY